MEQIAARLDDAFRLLTGGSRTALPRQPDAARLDRLELQPALRSRSAASCAPVGLSGGWTLEAAEAVCPCGKDGTVEMLEALARWSINRWWRWSRRTGKTRYRMLETIRQYAQEKLLETGEAAQMGDQHLEYFVTVAEGMEKKLHTPTYLDALEQIDVEVDISAPHWVGPWGERSMRRLRRDCAWHRHW